MLSCGSIGSTVILMPDDFKRFFLTRFARLEQDAPGYNVTRPCFVPSCLSRLNGSKMSKCLLNHKLMKYVIYDRLLVPRRSPFNAVFRINIGLI